MDLTSFFSVLLKNDSNRDQENLAHSIIHLVGPMRYSVPEDFVQEAFLPAEPQFARIDIACKPHGYLSLNDITLKLP